MIITNMESTRPEYSDETAWRVFRLRIEQTVEMRVFVDVSFDVGSVELSDYGSVFSRN